MSTAKAPAAPSDRICEKDTKNPFIAYLLLKNPKQRLKQSVNYHQLTKTETSRRRHL